MKLRCAEERKGRKNSQTTMLSAGAAMARLASRIASKPVKEPDGLGGRPEPPIPSMFLVCGHEIFEVSAQGEGEAISGQRVGRHVLEEKGASLVRHLRQHVLAVDAGIPAVTLHDHPG